MNPLEGVCAFGPGGGLAGLDEDGPLGASLAPGGTPITDEAGVIDDVSHGNGHPVGGVDMNRDARSARLMASFTNDAAVYTDLSHRTRDVPEQVRAGGGRMEHVKRYIMERKWLRTGRWLRRLVFPPVDGRRRPMLGDGDVCRDEVPATSEEVLNVTLPVGWKMMQRGTLGPEISGVISRPFGGISISKCLLLRSVRFDFLTSGPPSLVELPPLTRHRIFEMSGVRGTGDVRDDRLAIRDNVRRASCIGEGLGEDVGRQLLTVCSVGGDLFGHGGGPCTQDLSIRPSLYSGD